MHGLAHVTEGIIITLPLNMFANQKIGARMSMPGLAHETVLYGPWFAPVPFVLLLVHPRRV